MQPKNTVYRCKHTEAQAMLNNGAPLSVIARTLKLKISDIMRLEIERPLGKR
jgi:hypothetical protein